jgi:hypothetical protein
MNTVEDGFLSKKFLFSIGCVALTAIYCGLGATVMPGLKAYLDGFTSVIEFTVGAYLVGNLGNKAVALKLGSTPPDKAP